MRAIIRLITVITAVSLSAYAYIPQDVVDETIKKLQISKFDKSVLDAVERNPDFFKLRNDVRVEIKEIEPSQDIGITQTFEATKGIIRGVEDSVIVIDKIVNLASKIWDMVVANKPVININSKYAQALPFGVSSASQLSGWSKPKSYLISFHFENLYGIDVISVSYQITYVYGGSYKGKGRYLAAVWAIPVYVDVMWGFKFNMQAYVPDLTIVNVGTAQNPIAALQLKIWWSASSVLKQIDGTDVYYIQGDGYFRKIASSFEKSKVDLSNITENFTK